MKNRIKVLRKFLHLTGSEFGKVLGLSKMTISNIENGKNAITEQTFKTIIREFDVNEEWLRFGIGEMFVDRSKEDEIMAFIGKMYRDNDEFKIDFISALAKLSAEEWDLINSICIKLSSATKKEP